MKQHCWEKCDINDNANRDDFPDPYWVLILLDPNLKCVMEKVEVWLAAEG